MFADAGSKDILEYLKKKKQNKIYFNKFKSNLEKISPTHIR